MSSTALLYAAGGFGLLAGVAWVLEVALHRRRERNAALREELEVLAKELDDLKTRRDDTENWSEAWRRQNVEARRDEYESGDPAELLMRWRQNRRELKATLPRKVSLARRHFGEDPAAIRAMYESHIEEDRKRYELLTGKKASP